LRIIIELQSSPIDGFSEGSAIVAGQEGIDNFGHALEGFFLAGKGRHF
jgi:hypothetical protein